MDSMKRLLTRVEGDSVFTKVGVPFDEPKVGQRFLFCSHEGTVHTSPIKEVSALHYRDEEGGEEKTMLRLKTRNSTYLLEVCDEEVD